MNSRNMKVGTGSKEPALWNDDVALSMIGGGGKPAVLKRMRSILRAKKAANSFAV